MPRPVRLSPHPLALGGGYRTRLPAPPRAGLAPVHLPGAVGAISVSSRHAVPLTSSSPASLQRRTRKYTLDASTADRNLLRRAWSRTSRSAARDATPWALPAAVSPQPDPSCPRPCPRPASQETASLLGSPPADDTRPDSPPGSTPCGGAGPVSIPPAPLRPAAARIVSEMRSVFLSCASAEPSRVPDLECVGRRATAIEGP